MKLFKSLLVALCLLSITTSAWARPGGHHFRPRISIGLSAPPFYFQFSNRHSNGVTFYPYDYSWRYYPGVAVSPTISYVSPVVSTSDVVYEESYSVYRQNYVNDSTLISQHSPDRQTATGKDWLYCHQPDGFYPAIKSCPAGWHRVPAQSR
ncbi:hypothetical protein [Undibacterium sp.]|uniref:hypothetical protein n=1 Tax=Undibacterium sp. TaxID=1914977 RepID=UPI00272EF6CC|nr:hypothetical protein [Undibacterium sp.]MDP1976856.1 hypothetical protein [Undibacterium sp.]